jgi:hypothetical protein
MKAGLKRIEATTYGFSTRIEARIFCSSDEDWIGRFPISSLQRLRQLTQLADAGCGCSFVFELHQLQRQYQPSGISSSRVLQLDGDL